MPLVLKQAEKHVRPFKKLENRGVGFVLVFRIGWGLAVLGVFFWSRFVINQKC